MKKLAASALALVIAGATAHAAEHQMAPMTSEQIVEMRADLIRTRDIIDGAIYTSNEANDEGWDSATMYDAVGPDWNEIGEIEDIILSRDGQMIGVVAEVGGFLDIADKHVVLPLGDVRLVAVDDKSYAVVTRMNEEQLEALPDVDEGFWN